VIILPIISTLRGFITLIRNIITGTAEKKMEDFTWKYFILRRV
jgi:hypothetical protein